REPARACVELGVRPRAVAERQAERLRVEGDGGVEVVDDEDRVVERGQAHDCRSSRCLRACRVACREGPGWEGPPKGEGPIREGPRGDRSRPAGAVSAGRVCPLRETTRPAGPGTRPRPRGCVCGG